MASLIFNESEDDTKTLIDKYSKWFNSPSPGKYSLYHDRLRAYLLQKLGNHELKELNEKLISYLEKSLEDHKGDESEIYALEHLSTHMLVESQLNNNFKRFHEYVNNEVLWPRQISASKEYKWSQNGVQQSIKEAARRHDEDSSLESMVNSVKLTQDEESNVKQILDYLNKGDYQTSIKRIQNLELKNRLPMFLLMLHELTLGDLKESSYKIEIINEILKTIDETDLESFSFFYNDRNDYGDSKEYPFELILIYVVEIYDLNLNHQLLIDNLGINGADLILLIQGNGIGKIGIDKLLTFIDILDDEFYEIYSICSLVNKTKAIEKDNSNFILKNIELFETNFYLKNYNKNLNFDFKLTQSNISLDELLPLFYNCIKKVFEKSKYFADFDSYSYDYRLGHIKLTNQVLKIIVKYELSTKLSEKSLLLLKNNIQNSQLSTAYDDYDTFTQILIDRGQFKEALNYISSITDVFGNENQHTFDGIYCKILIEYHKKNIEIDYDYILKKIKSNDIKCLAYFGMAENYFNEGNISQAKIKLEKSEKLIYKKSDYNNGLNFSVNSLNNNAIQLLINLHYINKLNNRSKFIEIINEFLTINGLLSKKNFSEIEDIHRNRFKNLSFFLLLADINDFDEKITKQVEDFFFEEINKHAINYMDFSKTLEILPEPIHTKVLNLYTDFPRFNMINITAMDINTACKNIYQQLEILVKVPTKIAEHVLLRIISHFEQNQFYYKKIGELEKIKNEISLYSKQIESISNLNNSSCDIKENDLKNALNDKNPFSIYLFLNTLNFRKTSISLKQNNTTTKSEYSNYLDGCTSDSFFELKDYIDELYEKLKSNRKDFLSEKTIEELILNISKLKISEFNVLSIPFACILYYADMNAFNSFTKNLTKKDEIYFCISISLLGKTDLLNKKNNNKSLWESSYWVFPSDDTKKTQAFLLLKEVLKSYLLKLGDSDMGYYNNHREKILELVVLFIEKNQLIILMNTLKEVEVLFEIKHEETGWFAPITGASMPRDICFIIFENICEKLLECGFIKEALLAAEIMKEKNKVARVYIEYIKVLAKNNKIKYALEFVPKVLDLVLSSEEIPIDHVNYSESLEWPEKGISLLYLAEFYFLIQDINQSEKTINKALKEIDLKNNHLKIEEVTDDISKEYKTRKNRDSLDSFKKDCIIALLKINKIDNAISLANEIRIDLVSNYPNHSIAKCAISEYFFKNKEIDKAFSFIIDDGNIKFKDKVSFFKKLLSNTSYKDCVTVYNKYFESEKLLPSFIAILSSKVEENNDSEFMYLSKYGQGIFDKKYNSELDKDLLNNFMIAKVKRTKNIANNNSKLKILNEIFNIE